MNGALTGLKVIDWSAWLQGPVASMMLGDLGADIVKVEDPRGGDPSRGLVTVGGVSTGKLSRNFFFAACNRNKRSLAVDLKESLGIQIVHEMVKQSDVFLHNFRDDAAERLGLGYETLSKLNPGIIYAVGSGYGPLGPDSGKPSLDPTIHARSGVMDLFAPEGQPPHYVPGGMADQMAGVILAYGVLAALAARHREGVGQRVDGSLLGSMLWLQSVPVNFRLFLEREHPKFTREGTANPLYNYYRCRDGSWLFIALVQSDRFWAPLCQALSLDDLVSDPRFLDSVQRRRNKRVLIQLLSETFQLKDYSEWASVFDRIPGFVYEKVQSMDDVVHDAQAVQNRYIVEMTDPEWGAVRTVGCPVGFTNTPAAITRPAPELGQHTAEILMDLGYSSDDLAQLYLDQVIA